MKIRNKIVGALASAGIIAGGIFGAGSAAAWTGNDLGYLRGVTYLPYTESYKVMVGKTYCNNFGAYRYLGYYTAKAKARESVRVTYLRGNHSHAGSVQTAAHAFYC